MKQILRQVRHSTLIVIGVKSLPFSVHRTDYGVSLIRTLDPKFRSISPWSQVVYWCVSDVNLQNPSYSTGKNPLSECLDTSRSQCGNRLSPNTLRNSSTSVVVTRLKRKVLQIDQSRGRVPPFSVTVFLRTKFYVQFLKPTRDPRLSSLLEPCLRIVRRLWLRTLRNGPLTQEHHHGTRRLSVLGSDEGLMLSRLQKTGVVTGLPTSTYLYLDRKQVDIINKLLNQDRFYPVVEKRKRTLIEVSLSWSVSTSQNILVYVLKTVCLKKQFLMGPGSYTNLF